MWWFWSGTFCTSRVCCYTSTIDFTSHILFAGIKAVVHLENPAKKKGPKHSGPKRRKLSNAEENPANATRRMFNLAKVRCVSYKACYEKTSVILDFAESNLSWYHFYTSHGSAVHKLFKVLANASFLVFILEVHKNPSPYFNNFALRRLASHFFHPLWGCLFTLYAEIYLLYLLNTACNIDDSHNCPEMVTRQQVMMRHSPRHPQRERDMFLFRWPDMTRYLWSRRDPQSPGIYIEKRE